MALPDTEKPLSPSLMSGGRMGIPMIWRQVRMYSENLVTLSITELISAAINSSG